MSPYAASDVWNEFRKTASKRYGKRVFQAVAGREQLRQQLEHWLKLADPLLETSKQVEDLAADFLDQHDYDFQPTQGPQGAGASARTVVTRGGSLARVAAYAEALPAVLRAREEVLGTREPLPYAEAIDWLVRETQDPESRVLVELTFRFLIPKTSPVLDTVQSGVPGPELLDALDQAAVHNRIAPGARRPCKRPTETSLKILIGPDDDRIEVDLLKGNSDRLSALLFWARRLAGRCVGGATSEEAPSYEEGLAAAIWLILAGIWPRVSVEAIVHSWRGWDLIASERRPLRKTPYMSIRVETMDTSPHVIADAYQGLRKEARLSSAGRPPKPESEVLCMAALDVQEIDGLRRGAPGFYEAALRRYKAKAKDHGVNPDAFPDTAAGRDKARKILDGAERALGKRSSGSIFSSSAMWV
jgi:hypothetical protein